MNSTKLILATGMAGLCLLASASAAFEGRLQATLTRGGETQTILYTVGPNQLRIERGETNWPHAKNIVNLDNGSAITLVLPHSRSFVRLKHPAFSAAAPFPSAPGLAHSPAGLPPGVGSRSASPPVVAGPAGMPEMPLEKAELKATGEQTNLLGFACTRYELRQPGEVMEIWATDKLLPFQPWRASQPARFRPQMLEEQWGELLQQQKLFPLLAILKFEQGRERLRFEVKAITPEKIEDRDGLLFQPPRDYHQIEPLPF